MIFLLTPKKKHHRVSAGFAEITVASLSQSLSRSLSESLSIPPRVSLDLSQGLSPSLTQVDGCRAVPSERVCYFQSG